MAHTPPEEREEAIFEIVNQFNRGAELITSENERYQVAELNLVAGERAKASTAYASALKYFIAGEALLTNDPWERRHDLIFQLELRRAECEFLTGELTVAAERVEMLRSRAVKYRRTGDGHVPGYRCLHDARSDRPCSRASASTTCAISVSNGRSIQRRNKYEANTSGSGHNSEVARSRSVIDFPLMSDPTSIATLDVLTKVSPPALFTDYESFCPGRLQGG